jgi:hypothetical protein
MALTNQALKALKPAERPYKKFHERGLFVIVNPDGSIHWRFKYKFQSREKLLSLGQFPEVKISEAEKRRDKFREQLRDGIDPSLKRQAEKHADGDTFKAVAEEWLGQQKDISADTVEQFRTRLTAYLHPKIGAHKIGSMEPTDLLTALRSVEAKGRHDTAH